MLARSCRVEFARARTRSFPSHPSWADPPPAGGVSTPANQLSSFLTIRWTVSHVGATRRNPAQECDVLMHGADRTA
jgi:hypothetical protein